MALRVPARCILHTIRCNFRSFSSSALLARADSNKPPDSSGSKKYVESFFEEDPSKASGKTTVTILNKEESEGLFVDAYSNLGFRLNNGMRVMGPCAIFPRSILHWNVRGVTDINEDSLSLFTMLVPKLDILVIGVGERENTAKFNPQIIRYLRTKKINLEILSTDQALSTFNFLNSEKRYVAGAFIPPSYVSEGYNEDDLIYSSKRDIFRLETDFEELPSYRGELADLVEDQKETRQKFLDSVYRKEEWQKDPNKDKHEKH